MKLLPVITGLLLFLPAGAMQGQSPVFGLPGSAGSTVFWPANTGSAVFGLDTLPQPTVSWAMREGSGLTLNDTSGNGDTATISGATAVTWQSNTGISGTTPLWTGVGTATASNAALTNFDGTKPFSVTERIKTTQATEGVLVGDLNPSANFQGWEIENGDPGGAGGFVQFFLFNNFSTGNGIWLYGNAQIFDGVAHFIAITYDGSRKAAGVKIYVDGVLDTNNVTTDALTATTASTVPLHIGGRSNTTTDYVGALAGVQIFSNTVLSLEQIKALMAAL